MKWLRGCHDACLTVHMNTTTGIHIDEVLDVDGTVLGTLRCLRGHAADCDPGNCEDAHIAYFGLDTNGKGA